MRHMSVKTVPDFVPTVAGGEEMAMKWNKKQKIEFGIVLINKNQSCQELIIFVGPLLTVFIDILF